jgi:acyl-CoA thioesterase FadM
MNLYFRLLLFFLSLPFIKKIDPKKPIDFNHKSEMIFRVLPNDLDIFNHMNNGRYLSIMDFGRFHYMTQYGALKKAFKNNWSPAVGGVRITYIRSLRLFEKYKLTTQILCWDEKWVYMEQQFIKLKDNQLMATGLVRALFVKNHVKISSDELMTTFFPGGIISPEMPDAVRKWRESEGK